MSEKELRKHYTDAECQTLFASLFSEGFAGKDVLEDIAFEGWLNSTLHFIFHPTLEQVHWERVQLHRKLRDWPWFPTDGLDEPEPTLEEVHADYQASPVDSMREVRELIAMCLWDVFSNENDVVDRDRWRQSGGSRTGELIMPESPHSAARRPKHGRFRLDREDYRTHRRHVLERDCWRCQDCGSMHNLQVHHMKRRSQLGGDVADNLITLCSACHEDHHRRHR